jgi:hypothetical protein
MRLAGRLPLMKRESGQIWFGKLEGKRQLWRFEVGDDNIQNEIRKGGRQGLDFIVSL